MRLTSLLWVAIVLSVPAMVRAQYDFDDFMQAVEVGQSKTTAPSLDVPKLAQVPNGPVQAPPSDLQPLLVNPAETIEFLPPTQPVPNSVDVDQLFDLQDRGLSDPVRLTSHGCQSCGHSSHARECSVLPYQTPRLPAPSSLRGYFNASPCIVNVWDGYSCEAAAACAKTRQCLMGRHGHPNGCGCGKTPCE